ncbi:MAG: HAD-IB family phosphatase [Patescibacteria group bacterium]
MNASKPLAFFDIDGTFIRSSLLVELCRNLVRFGVFPAIAERELAETRVAWEERRAGYHPFIMAVVEVYYRHLAGCNVAQVARIADITAREQRHRVYVYTRELIQRLRDTHTIIAISGSPEPAVRPFTEAWGFDQKHVFCSAAETVNGRYTGRRLIKIVEEGKQRFVDACIATIPHATLAHSIGVGDTEYDVSVLERVAHPIAFNPTVALARIARARGWRVVVERKDAIWVNGRLITDIAAF